MAADGYAVVVNAHLGRNRSAAVACVVALAVLAVFGCGVARATAWQLRGPYLHGVDCPTAGTCVAVGDPVNYGVRPFVASWDWSRWHEITAPVPRHGGGWYDGSEFAAVSCVTATTCLAVGSNDGERGGTIAEAGGAAAPWRVLPAPPDPAQGTALPAAVSCANADACLAGGWSVDDRTDRFGGPWAVWWNGARWTLLAPPTPPGDANEQIADVDCVAANACVVVGGGLAAWWNGHTWRLDPIPARAGAGLTAVSCVGPDFCLAVGARDTARGERPVTLRWDGRRWALKPSPAFGPGFGAVSCPAADRCFALSTSHTRPRGQVWQTDHWVDPGGSASLLPVPSNLGESAYQLLSCASVTRCLAIGQAVDPIAARWTGQRWKQIPSPSPS